MGYWHEPVMLEEVLEYSRLRPGDGAVDCTLGGGGYSFAMSERVGSLGRVLGIDLDPMAIKNAQEKIKKQKKENLKIINGNFSGLHKIIKDNFSKKEQAGIAAVVFDLGLSSAQLEDRNRGFSFQLDAPLNMSFGGADSVSAADMMNNLPEKEIKSILTEYGEERYASGIAAAIFKTRKKKKIKTTKELVGIIEKAVPWAYRRSRRIHFATRTFQALRIASNKELENLRCALPQALEALKPGGRIIVVSYHSLEDRIVKRFFRRESRDCLCPSDIPVCRCGHKAALKIINKKIIIPQKEEIKKNKRARSAKMRVAEKI